MAPQIFQRIQQKLTSFLNFTVFYLPCNLQINYMEFSQKYIKCSPANEANA